MSSADDPVARLAAYASRRPQRESRRGGRVEVALTAATFVALLVAMLPLTRVVNSGTWTIGVLVLPALVLVTGAVARWYRLPAVAVSLAEALVGLFALTAVFLRDSALFGIVPTPRTFTVVGGHVADAFDQIVNGAAPLEAREGLAFLIVAGIVLLTVVVDHVVLTARMPLLAAVALIAVWLIPSIAVPRELDIVAFVLLAAVVLVMLRFETRARERDAAAAAAEESGGAVPAADATSVLPGAGIAAAAAGIGAVAVVISLVAAPVFSGVVVPAGTGPGSRFNSIDASLALGDDLRKQSNSEVLRYRTTSAAAPYLRVATLSNFDGEIWRADRGRSVALDSEEAYGTFEPNDEIRVVESTTSIEIENLASTSAPVTYPARSIEGLDGEWGSIPFNGTVVSRSTSVNGQDYEVVAEYVRPTLEQIRAAEAQATGALDSATTVPDGVPAIVGEWARTVTAEATNDYDALAALQRWFRSGEFAYSLEAPVEDGFDGSGADAIGRFLEVREGYCIHFASAFALMARMLEMPSRIVVGYLPGSSMSSPTVGDRVYSVMASQLHAWPEVYFDGIGWIAFEPTNSLGTPTSFSPAAVLTDADADETDPSAAPEASATPTPSVRPEGLDERGADAASGANPLVRALPWLWPLLVVLVVAAIPGVVRALRRRALARAAQGGDAVAAWRSLQDDAIDLGIPVPPDESPRAFGARLVATHGAPVDAVEQLVDAIELASYAPEARRRWRPTDLDAATSAVRAGLRSRAARGLRVAAVVAPRSLLIRPGSVYAGDGLRAGARS